MYTPAQASQILQLATSTLRKYSRIFADNLSRQTNRQHRRYTEKDISILQHAILLRDQGLALEEINRQLAIMQESASQEPALQTGMVLSVPSETPLEINELRLAIDHSLENVDSLTEQVRQENREIHEILNGLQEENRRLRREIEIIKEDRAQEQTQLKQDIQAELSGILADFNAARDELKQDQEETTTPTQGTSNDVTTELMQIRAEIYRLKDAQKRTEQKLKSLSERMDTPFWRRGPKNPLES